MITMSHVQAAWAHHTVLALKDCMQDLRWHPEGDAFTHTQQVMLKLTGNVVLKGKSPEDMKLMLAVVLHDIGKVPTRNVEQDGTITHRSHAEVGAGMAWCVMGDLNIPAEDHMDVFWIIKNHMFTLHYAGKAKDKTLRKYMSHPMWENLLRLGLADSQSGTQDDVELVLARAENIRIHDIGLENALTG